MVEDWEGEDEGEVERRHLRAGSRDGKVEKLERERTEGNKDIDERKERN